MDKQLELLYLGNMRILSNVAYWNYKGTEPCKITLGLHGSLLFAYQRRQTAMIREEYPVFLPQRGAQS